MNNKYGFGGGLEAARGEGEGAARNLQLDLCCIIRKIKIYSYIREFWTNSNRFLHNTTT